jgi:hypothetical protein
VVEKVKCFCQAVQYYKLNMRNIGKIDEGIHRKRGKRLLLIQEMTQVYILFH